MSIRLLRKGPVNSVEEKNMKKILSGLCATALAFSFAISTAVPVNAAPIVVPKVQSTTDVKLVQMSPELLLRRLQGRELPQNRRQFRSEFRSDRREFRREIRRDRREFRREVRRDRREFRRDRDYAWYRGHRGYRDYRPGYRRHNGFWFPAAAFITGAIIGGALSQPAYRGGGSAHVEWCYNRYRSYRAYDNTYQPYNGPRRQCYSPYN
jgi:hypothetical protein